MSLVLATTKEPQKDRSFVADLFPGREPPSEQFSGIGEGHPLIGLLLLSAGLMCRTGLACWLFAHPKELLELTSLQENIAVIILVGTELCELDLAARDTENLNVDLQILRL